MRLRRDARTVERIVSLAPLEAKSNPPEVKPTPRMRVRRQLAVRMVERWPKKRMLRMRVRTGERARTLR